MSTRDGAPISWGARSAKGTERSGSAGHGQGANRGEGGASSRGTRAGGQPTGAGSGVGQVTEESRRSKEAGDEARSESDSTSGSAAAFENAATSGSAAAATSENAAASEDAAASESADISGGVESVARERDEYLDALRRLQAEFENYKKRVIKQQTAHLERAAEGLVDKLLPVLDTLDLAQAHAESNGDGAGDGEALVQVRSMLNDVLAREGLERIDPLDQPFDPTAHEAVMHEEAPGEGEAKDPLVTEVFRAGYRWKGRVIRPAMVKVTG